MHLALLAEQTTAHPHGFLGHLLVTIQHFAGRVMTFLRPYGAWGLAGLALFDSALLPLPVPMDGIVVGYVAENRSAFLLYSLVAAAASTLGSLLPFFTGRLGGELLLLKRINRERYERLRDRFEKQEFLAILLPAMGPPPTPIKIFEFAAGIFEMRIGPYLLAMFLGKFIQFLAFALLTYLYGPSALAAFTHTLHAHGRLILSVLGLLLVLVILAGVRRAFDRRKPLVALDGEGTHTIVEE